MHLNNVYIYIFLSLGGQMVYFVDGCKPILGWDVYPILVKRQYDFAMRIVGIIFVGIIFVIKGVTKDVIRSCKSKKAV